jgi:hypothetical protein
MTVVWIVVSLGTWFLLALGLALILGRLLDEEMPHPGLELVRSYTDQPVPGEPGWRQDKNGNWWYSAEWLSS